MEESNSQRRVGSSGPAQEKSFHLQPSNPDTHLGMNLASSPSLAWKSCQAWLGPTAPQGAASAAAASPSSPSSSSSSSVSPGWNPAWDSASAGSRSPKPRRCPPRRAPRKPRANSWKVMAPSRSESSRWNTASASAGRTRSSAHNALNSSRSRRPERFASQAAKTERNRASSSRSPSASIPPDGAAEGAQGLCAGTSARAGVVASRTRPAGWTSRGNVRVARGDCAGGGRRVPTLAGGADPRRLPTRRGSPASGLPDAYASQECVQVTEPPVRLRS